MGEGVATGLSALPANGLPGALLAALVFEVFQSGFEPDVALAVLAAALVSGLLSYTMTCHESSPMIQV